MKAKVLVTLKEGVLDPQGKAIQATLDSLGFDGVEGVRQGKYIELSLMDTSTEMARQKVELMCRNLLANMVIETYSIDIEN